MGPNKKLWLFSSHRHTRKYVIQFHGVHPPRSPPLGSATCRPGSMPQSECKPHRAVLFHSHLCPQCPEQWMASINVHCICHVNEFKYTVVRGVVVVQKEDTQIWSQRLALPGSHFFCWPDPTPRLTNVNVKLPFINCLLCTRY